MAAFDYIESRADADELLTEFGQAVSLRRVVPSGDEWNPTITPTDYATTAALLDYDDRQIDGERILRGDRRALVAAGPLTTLGITAILDTDAIVVGGVAVQVVRSNPVNPAGLVVLHDVQLRF